MDNAILLTKIIATLGPSSSSVELVGQLIREGVRVFRVNFSHGSIDSFSRIIDNVRQAAALSGVPAAILGDLSGPKIRIGQVPDPGIELIKGEKVEFTAQDTPAFRKEDGTVVFSTTSPEIVCEVRTGQRIMIDDGNVVLICTGKHEDRLVCEVMQAGRVSSKKGINLPETDLTVAAMTEWDDRCVEFAVAKKVDYLALSFVRHAKDIIHLKEILAALGARPFSPFEYHADDMSGVPDDVQFIPIISKIEKPQAIDDLDGIVAESDAIMIARGDLGVEMELAEVAVLQKKIISACHDQGVPVIVATQMLQSMIESPVPTRAEVSDVANAIYDGVDAVMLSGETAVGRYPVETVRMMARIARLTNEHIRSRKIARDVPGQLRESKYRSAALAHGVKSIVRDIDAKLIIIWSKFGGGALYLSQLDIPLPIIAFSNLPATLNRLSLLYGIQPELMEQPETPEEFIRKAGEKVLKTRRAGHGDAVIFVYGEPIRSSGVTNSIYIHYL
ncbi:MAG TPA: pyruvate kinase [Bacteroidales bacterium]|nr:pyruvate kinase [Bacteroidales bacterium]HPM92668.1 pyruvate kinase [Bacteroidales bacterium]